VGIEAILGVIEAAQFFPSAGELAWDNPIEELEIQRLQQLALQIVLGITWNHPSWSCRVTNFSWIPKFEIPIPSLEKNVKEKMTGWWFGTCFMTFPSYWEWNNHPN
jgi:hypothetical protein